MPNPIQYTSRTFLTIMADINADPYLADKPDWFKRLWAGIGDILSVWENFSANNNFLRTAITRRAVYDLCTLIGYEMYSKVSSSGDVFFDIPYDLVLPVSFLPQDLAGMTQGASANSARRFEARAGITVVDVTEIVASTSWNTGTGVITVVESYLTGEKIRLSTTGGLPAGTSATKDYYVIRIGLTSIKIAESRKEAYAGTYLAFTTQGTGNHTIRRLSRVVTVYQQTSVAPSVIGSSDGIKTFQQFPLTQVGIQPATVVITINGVNWNQVSSFIDSISTSKDYRIIFKGDGTADIQFGDGVYGAIPGNFAIYASYAYGGGSSSNVLLPDSINAYCGSSSNISGVSNPGAVIGGDDAETIEHAKVIAPMFLKARDRFVTADDGAALLLAYGGLSQVRVNVNVYGVLSCQVIAVANGGGSPGSTLRTTMAGYLKGKSLLSSIDVHFDAGTYTPHSISMQVKVLAGYTSVTVLDYVKTAMLLFFSDTGVEIRDAYIAKGITEAVKLINLYFTKAYGVNDYVVIDQMLVQFTSDKGLNPRTFGDTITISDLYSFLTYSVPGIDYLLVVSPAFPITHTDSEISQAGTMTVAAI